MDLRCIRTARPFHVAAVLAVLTGVKKEIPVRLDGWDRRKNIRALVYRCCKGKVSWVALDKHRRVVGFLLGKCRWIRSPRMEFSGVELLKQAKALGTPLYAVVKHRNSIGMAERLVKADFVRQRESLFPDERAFIWTPASRR